MDREKELLDKMPEWVRILRDVYLKNEENKYRDHERTSSKSILKSR